MTPRRGERGVALIAVLVFVAVAISAVVLFVQRSTYNVLAINNHDASARAEALARGGVRLAQALLIDDRVREDEADFRADSLADDWARARAAPITLPNGDALVLAIEDSGSRLNLNALFADGAAKDAATETYLLALMEKAIDELPEAAEKHAYDPEELAHALMDYIDQDEERTKGGTEDDTYLARRPPSRAANRALLSVDELGAVEGFDAALVEVLRPYITVFPYQGENAGINPNTAPPWVLALLYTGTSGHFRLVDESEVRRILEVREGGALLCADEANAPGCTPLRSVLPDGVFPAPSFESDVFMVTAEAQSGATVRTVTAVVDRSELGDPKLLAIQTY
ncbi:MAG: type II secretion system minor pseudopilin GspK [Deltaproteobacteria bacterium]|nr:type II secretion system minor pseudopilin GspK [Deltaproteobacteria bacterium]